MTHTFFTGMFLLIILIGSITFLALAGLALIYCKESTKSPRFYRIFFGILGVSMFYAFINLCDFIMMNGWPL